MCYCRVLIFISMICFSVGCFAQTDFDAFKQKANRDFDAFKQRVEQQYETHRQKVNADYAEHMKRVWREFNAFKGVPVPEDDVKPVPPKPFDDKQKEQPIIDQELPTDPVVEPVPEPKPQPKPVEPIEDKPVVAPSYFTTKYCGTTIKVRLSPREKFHLKSLSETHVAEAWNALCTDEYDNLLYDCLKCREDLHLCDWAYMCMLSTLCEEFCGNGTNEATLMLAWLYCQSGYTMRIGAYEKHLEMLFASEHKIYSMPYYVVGGQQFYPIHQTEQKLRIFDHAFDGEQSMSLLIGAEQNLAVQTTKVRKIVSRDFPQMTFNVQTNQNNLTFYNTYPTSELHDNFMTRWAMYANVPLSESTRRQFYPALHKQLSGKTQLETVNQLLNWVQTGFEYEYDDKVWGGDRAFFAEETLYYPYCDCEDRSILFSRLVRDIVGLDVVLVYYPGHLATAVAFTENVRGDYMTVNGRKFVVCDPTYIGAPVGYTMPEMDNKTASVIQVK